MNEGYYSHEHGFLDKPLVPIRPPPPPESPPPFIEGEFGEPVTVPPRRPFSPEPVEASPRSLRWTQLDQEAAWEAAGLVPNTAEEEEEEEDEEEEEGEGKEEGDEEEERKEQDG
ncbi:hypothetical protein KC352_g27615, partial [Hortaea werneckii]